MSGAKLALLLWLVRLLVFPLLVLWQFLAFVGDLHVGSETLIILILHFLNDSSVLSGEVQGVIGFGIGRKPVFSVNLLTPGGEFGEQVLLAFLLADVGHAFAEGLDDLKIALIHPDAALEIALLPHDFLGSDVEDVAVQL